MLSGVKNKSGIVFTSIWMENKMKIKKLSPSGTFTSLDLHITASYAVTLGERQKFPMLYMYIQYDTVKKNALVW